MNDVVEGMRTDAHSVVIRSTLMSKPSLPRNSKVELTSSPSRSANDDSKTRPDKLLARSKTAIGSGPMLTAVKTRSSLSSGSAGFASKMAQLRKEHSELDADRVAALERLAQLESRSDNIDDLIGFSAMTLEESKGATAALVALMEIVDPTTLPDYGISAEPSLVRAVDTAIPPYRYITITT